MTLKEAKKACRELALRYKRWLWYISYTKQKGYYPTVTCSKDSNTIGYVERNGVFVRMKEGQ